MKKVFLLMLSSLLLASCNLSPAPVANTTNILGTLELPFGGNDQPRFKPRASLTPMSDSSISIFPSSFVTRDVGSVRTLTATFTIFNHGFSFSNLSLIAYSKTGNASKSALKNISAFNGAPSSTDVYGVVPAQGTDGNVDVAEFKSDLQIYTPNEANNFTYAARSAGIMNSGEEALEYGFVARQNASSHLRSIANGATAQVSISMKIPVSADVTSGTRFVMTFIVANDNVPHVVQSNDESVDGTAAAARASAVGAGTEIRAFYAARTAGDYSFPLAWTFGSVLKYEQLQINTIIPVGPGSDVNTYGTVVTRAFNIPSLVVNITKVTLRVKITTPDGRTSLRVRLTSPGGVTKIMYSDPNGADGGSDLNITFDDTSTNTLNSLCFPNFGACNGTVQPINALSDFNGASIAGNWTVTVDDNGFSSSSPSATLNELALQMSVSPTP